MADEVITLVETTETIVVQQTNQQIVEVIQPPTPQIIEVVQQGVQGPPGPPGPNTIGGYPIIMDGSANNGDVLSFSTSIMAWYNRAEQTLTDGGNF